MFYEKSRNLASVRAGGADTHCVFALRTTGALFLIVIFLNILSIEGIVSYAKETDSIYEPSLLSNITITTENGQNPTCEYISAPEGCWGNTITNNEYLNCVVEYYDPNRDTSIIDNKAKIKIRGNMSAYGDKKPYKLKLSSKQSFNTGESSKKWVLLKGGTNLNFLFSNWTFDYCGVEWQPKFEFVNVTVNGDYKGCYILVEAVEQISKTIDFDETGFLVENDAYWWDSEYSFKVENQIPQLGFTFKEPDYEDISENQIDAVCQKVNSAVEKICDTNDNDEYLNYIRVESFASWFVAKDYVNGLDSGGSNMYWYSSSIDEPLSLGPAWDYDHDYENDILKWSPIHSNKNNFGFYIFQKDSFKKVYRNQFEKSKCIINDLTDYINRYINIYGESLQKSWNMDAERWNTTPGSVEKIKDKLLNYYSKRIEWISEATLGWSLDFSQYDNAIKAANDIDGTLYENFEILQSLMDVDVYELSYTQEALDNLTEDILKAIEELRLKTVQVEILGAPYKTFNDECLYDVSVPHIIINQVYGGKKKESYASHSFIELYNQTDEIVDLTGWSLQYRSSKDGGDDTSWSKLDLSGTIPSHCSYLIRCKSIKDPVEGSIVIDNYDQDWNQVINNKGCSVVLVANNKLIPADSTVFDNEIGKPAIYDYVDMVGVSGNDIDTEENIANEAALFYEGEASPIQSKKNGIRREKQKDTDNNADKKDFIAVDYSFENADYIAYISPKCVADGKWEYSKNNVPKYTVTFVEYEDIISQNKFKYNTKVEKPKDPKRKGYTFTGWFEDEECTSLYKFKDKPVSDITLYAGWTPIDYTITYYNVDGADNSNPISYTIEDDDIILANPVKEGSVFYGWYSDAEFTGEDITTIVTSDIENIELYARWKEIITPELAIDGWTYGKSANDPEVSGPVSGAAISFEYKTKGSDDSTYSENVPILAGDYTVKATLFETEEYVFDEVTTDFTIARAQLTIKAVDSSKLYSNLDPLFTAEVIGLQYDDSADDVVYTLYRASGENVGTYSLIPAGNAVQGNYDIVYTEGTFTVSAKTVTGPAIVLSGDSFVYDGTEKTPGVTVMDGSTVIDPSEYNVNIFNNTAAGTATVTITDKDGGNYTVSGSKEFAISKAIPTILIVPEAGSLTFGQSLADSAVTGGAVSVAGTFAWDDAEIIPSVANSDVTEYSVVFTPADTDNYDTVKFGVKVSVAKAEPQYTVPAGITAVYGDTLADVELPDGWAWADSSVSVGDVGVHSFAAIYTPVDTVNYNNAEAQIEVSVGKDAPVLTVPVAKANLTYTGTAQELVSVSAVSGGAISFALVIDDGADLAGVPGEDAFSGDVPTGTSAGTYTIWYKVTGDDNHLDTEPASLTVVIGRASAVVYADNSSKAYGEADPALSATVSGLKGNDTQDVFSYSLFRSAGESVGTYNIIAMGDAVQGNYNVSYVQGAFTIETKLVTDPVIILSQDSFVYDGTAKTPSVTVRVGNTIIDPSEYIVTYSNNIEAGTATVTITDKVGGSFEISGSVTFTITESETENQSGDNQGEGQGEGENQSGNDQGEGQGQDDTQSGTDQGEGEGESQSGTDQGEDQGQDDTQSGDDQGEGQGQDESQSGNEQGEGQGQDETQSGDNQGEGQGQGESQSGTEQGNVQNQSGSEQGSQQGSSDNGNSGYAPVIVPSDNTSTVVTDLSNIGKDTDNDTDSVNSYIPAPVKHVIESLTSEVLASITKLMTGGGKEVVAAEIEIGSKMVTLKKGMTTNIKPKLVIKYSDGTEQTISDVSKFRFVNMTSSVASVSKKGRVTALRTGTGYIYIVAEYGMFKKIQVKVVDKK